MPVFHMLLKVIHDLQLITSFQFYRRLHDWGFIRGIKHDFPLGPEGSVENRGYALGFQHSSRDLANVNGLQNHF